MNKIEMVPFSELKIAPFKATYILRPDLLSLSSSLYDLGFIIPIVVQASTNIVIDGNERVLIATGQKTIAQKVGEECPVVKIDCDSMEAQMLHLRLNRSRGNLLAKPMSNIVRNLIQSRKYQKEQLNSLLQMKDEELTLLMDGSLLKQRNVSKHTYSRAWVPVEADAKITEMPITIEAPPGPDR